MARARIHAPGERGPSWRYSNTGGASAAFRHRPTRKQGLQGLRFAPGSVGKRAESPVSAGLCGMAATRKVRTLMRTWFAGLHPGQTKNGQDRKLNAGAGLQPIRWLGCRNRPTSLCARSDASQHLYAHLPASAYYPDEINIKAGAVFAHIYSAGLGGGTPVYH